MTEDGRQRTGDRSQRSEVRDQRTDDRGNIPPHWNTPVGAAFQPRHHYSDDFNDLNDFNDLTN